MCRKANFLLHSFKSCDPVVKTFLFSSHCLSLYGALSWKLSCPKLKSLEVTFNNILQKIWRLPRICHTGILNCTAKVYSIINRIICFFISAYKRAVASKCDLVKTLSSSLIYCTTTAHHTVSSSTLMMIGSALTLSETFNWVIFIWV